MIFFKGCSKVRKRSSKLSVLEMLDRKYEKKAELKEKQIEQKQLELELKMKKHDEEAEERKQRFQLEMEERRAFLELLKSRI